MRVQWNAPFLRIRNSRNTNTEARHKKDHGTLRRARQQARRGPMLRVRCHNHEKTRRQFRSLQLDIVCHFFCGPSGTFPVLMTSYSFLNVRYTPRTTKVKRTIAPEKKTEIGRNPHPCERFHDCARCNFRAPRVPDTVFHREIDLVETRME